MEKAVDEKFCNDCGKAIKIKASMCVHCGVKQGVAMGDKSRVSAILFALFLGGFGAHKFYLGRTGAGLCYLFFFWTFIPAFIAFIDMIMLIASTDDAFNVKYATP